MLTGSRSRSKAARTLPIPGSSRPVAGSNWKSGKRHAPDYWAGAAGGDAPGGSTLTTELCVIDGRYFFVRARIVLPVKDAAKTSSGASRSR